MNGHRTRRRAGLTLTVVASVSALQAGALTGTADAAVPGLEVQSLDGRGNNTADPTWGQVGTNYARVAAPRYADGLSAQVTGPNARAISNRIFNDSHQNLFSGRRVTQWAFAWGQFLDHTFGLRQAPGVGDTPDPSSRNIPVNPADPMEEFVEAAAEIPFTRSLAAPGTGVTTPRQQVNTVSSYIDAWAVYGGTAQRLEWLREGPVDGNLANNSARLLLPDGRLPRRDTRGDAASAPVMDVDGRLRARPDRAMVAGDVRANENFGLTATHTLFAREHNRIVGLLPGSLSEEDRFQIARRVVAAEQQYITYNEFLPALGVRLPRYTGYDATVDATLTNEFATVGYRAHSMIHGELETEVPAGEYTAAEIAALEAQGVEIAREGDDLELAVPLNLAFFNPDLLDLIGVDPILHGLGLESQYRNDEQIDNQLRSVLFQVPVGGNPECLDGEGLPECFDGVVDLGAIDVERSRDHGMPGYNQLRQAYGLTPRTSFTAITGEPSDTFPNDPELGPNPVDDPDSLDFVRLADIDGNEIDLADEDAAEGTATTGERRTPLAARLRAVYGTVDALDAFTGMVSEAHVPGTDMGELQLAIWTREFRTLRDGDRFFYGNDPGLTMIRDAYGIDYRRTLAQVIADNTSIPASELNPDVFLVADADLPATTCRVQHVVTTTWPGNYQVNLTVTNTGTRPVNGWTLRWEFANGQGFTQLWNGDPTVSVSGDVAVTNLPYNAAIPVGGRVTLGFNALRDAVTNPTPVTFTLNGARCSTS